MHAMLPTYNYKKQTEKEKKKGYKEPNEQNTHKTPLTAQ